MWAFIYEKVTTKSKSKNYDPSNLILENKDRVSWSKSSDYYHCDERPNLERTNLPEVKRPVSIADWQFLFGIKLTLELVFNSKFMIYSSLSSSDWFNCHSIDETTWSSRDHQIFLSTLNL